MPKPKKPKTKVKTGCPTKYDPSYCEMLIEHMAKGFSYECFGAVVNTSVSTLYNWEKDFPEFLEAKNIAFEKNRYFYEAAGIDGMWEKRDGKKLNSSVWIVNMRNRFGWCKEKKENEKPNEINNEAKVIIQLPSNARETLEESDNA